MSEAIKPMATTYNSSFFIGRKLKLEILWEGRKVIIPARHQRSLNVKYADEVYMGIKSIFNTWFMEGRFETLSAKKNVQKQSARVIFSAQPTPT